MRRYFGRSGYVRVCTCRRVIGRRCCWKSPARAWGSSIPLPGVSNKGVRTLHGPLCTQDLCPASGRAPSRLDLNAGKNRFTVDQPHHGEKRCVMNASWMITHTDLKESTRVHGPRQKENQYTTPHACGTPHPKNLCGPASLLARVPGPPPPPTKPSLLELPPCPSFA